MELLRKFYMADSSGGGNPKDQVDGLKETVADLKDAFVSIGQIIKREITGNISEANQATKQYGKSIASSLESTLKSMGKNSQDVLDNMKGLQDGSLKLTTVLKQQEALERKRLQAEIDIKNAYKNGVISLTRMRTLTGELTEKTKEQNALLALQGIEAARIEKSMGNFGKIFKGIAKIPIVGQLVDAEKVTKRMQEAAAAGAGKWKTFGAGIKATFASIGESLTDPVTIIAGLYQGLKKIVQLATEFQSKQFETAKDLGVSVQRGKELRDNFVALARANISLGVTADQLQKSYAGVQDELGIIVKQSDEFNLSSALIERRTGATAENMATLQFASGKMGKSLMETYQAIEGSAKAEGGRVKLAMSEKQVLEGISKVSATVYQNFKGNYKELAAAVIEAKKLGISLDQVNATQDQFLDFESSISKQFEAEVLTGRDLNLTRARELALAHDTKGLMEEMTKQLGSQNEWNNLNTIAQQSLAESLGLSRDAVNQMYMDQEKAKVLGEAAGEDLKTQYEYLVGQGVEKKEIVRLLGQESVASAQQASVAEKTAATMDAIKNSIAEASTILLPMIEKVAGWLADTEHLKLLFTGILGVMGGIAAYSIAMKAASMAQVASQITLLQLQVAQGVNMQKALVTAGLLAEEEVVGAAAAATAGAGYLGPGALAVGAAVITALGGYLGMSAMGSSTPSSTTAMTRPIEPATAAVNSAASANGTKQEAAPIYSFHHVTQLDGQVLTKSVTKGVLTTQGQGNTIK
jgi:hypothetical protein